MKHKIIEFYKLVKNLISVIHIRYFCRKDVGWGNIGKNSHILGPSIISGKGNIFIGNNVNIDWDNVIYATNAAFTVKDNTGIATGFKAITGNHRSKVGEFFKTQGNRNLEGKPIMIEEEVWIGANVILLAGTKIGRGAVVSAGTVVGGAKVPPYAIVAGNPCKIIGYRFTPQEIIEHENALYRPEERMSLQKLQKNYDKYFENREKIAEFVGLY